MQEMGFPGFKFQKYPQVMHGIFATQVAFSHSFPPLIYCLTERSLFKKPPPPPPHGKILKKGPDQYTKTKLLNVCFHIKFILLTTPRFSHLRQCNRGQIKLYIYKCILNCTAIRWTKKLFAEGSRCKKVVCNNNRLR